MNQSITKVPVVARVQMATETPVLIVGYTDQKESFLGEPYFLVASSGSVLSISAPTTTAFNGSQPTVQPTNGAHRINDQLEDIFIEEAYLVFLSSDAQSIEKKVSM